MAENLVWVGEDRAAQEGCLGGGVVYYVFVFGGGVVWLALAPRGAGVLGCVWGGLKGGPS